MARPRLRTNRIDLRPMTIEHLPLLHRLDSDAEVMRLLLGRSRTPEEINDFWAPRCWHVVADQAGLGWWVGLQGDTFLGWWDLGAPLVRAETMAANVASRNVMRKIGMRHIRTWVEPLRDVHQGKVRYEISARDWRRGTGRTICP